MDITERTVYTGTVSVFCQLFHNIYHIVSVIRITLH